MIRLDELTGKLQKIGKDRYAILFLIGIMCVVIAAILDNAEKKQSVADKEMTADTAGSMGESQDSWGGQNSETGRAAVFSGDSSVDSGSMLSYSEYFEEHLEKMLSKMEGVGKVCVVVTMQSSEEMILEKNTPYRRQTDEETKDGQQSMTTEIESDSQVVFYENSDGRQVPIVVRRCAPTVRGIVVLAQGADMPGVSEKISQLLVALFGIDEHKIKVAKYST